MVFVGSKVRVKSLDQIIDENLVVINPRNGLPCNASDRMAVFYGSDKVYTVDRYVSHKYDFEDDVMEYAMLKADIGRGLVNYEFDANELEVVEESPFKLKYKAGDKIIVKETHCYHGGDVGDITYITANVDAYGFLNTVYEIDGEYNLRENEIDRICDENYVPPRRIRCERCGVSSVVNPADISKIYPEDLNLCECCRKREYVAPYHRYRPHLEFFGAENNEDGLFFGVEVEVDSGGESDSNARSVMRIMNDEKMFITCSHDGSLRDGFEIVTQPATLEYHKSIMDKYKSAFKHLVSLGYRSHDTSTAGIHVHFSRSFYEDNEEDNIAKLLYLVEKFWDDIVVFSRRDYRTLERYAKKTNTSSVDDALDFIDAWNKNDDHDGHYYAVNISNPDTIELRFYRGTLNGLTFEAILEFTDSLVRTAKELSVNELQALTFDEMLTPLCKKYYDSRVLSLEFDETKNK